MSGDLDMNQNLGATTRRLRRSSVFVDPLFFRTTAPKTASSGTQLGVLERLDTVYPNRGSSWSAGVAMAKSMACLAMMFDAS